MGDRHAVEHIVLRHLELDKFRLSVRKGRYLKCGRQIQNAGRLLCRLKLRVDDHGKAELFTKVSDLLAVIRCAYTRNGCTVTDLLCDCAGQQVQLIRIGHCDDQICRLDPGFLLHTIACAVAGDPHNVVHICYFFDLCRVVVNDDDIMPFPAELLDQGLSDLAAANNNNS